MRNFIEKKKLCTLSNGKINVRRVDCVCTWEEAITTATTKSASSSSNTRNKQLKKCFGKRAHEEKGKYKQNSYIDWEKATTIVCFFSNRTWSFFFCCWNIEMCLCVCIIFFWSFIFHPLYCCYYITTVFTDVTNW